MPNDKNPTEKWLKYYKQITKNPSDAQDGTVNTRGHQITQKPQ